MLTYDWYFVGSVEACKCNVHESEVSQSRLIILYNDMDHL